MLLVLIPGIVNKNNNTVQVLWSAPCTRLISCTRRVCFLDMGGGGGMIASKWAGQTP